MTSGPQLISSRDNPLLKDLRRLAQDNTAYRKQGQVWLEGDHLCRAALDRGVTPALAVFSQNAWDTGPRWAPASTKTVIMAEALFAGISGLESPAGMGFVIDLPQPGGLAAGVATVILDRVQDAGNVGSILRSASAFGFRQVVALKGTAALWSPKVLRAGMGAHFGLQLVEGADTGALADLGVPILVTSSHEGQFLGRQRLPRPCAWAMGHEGQGISPALAALASQSVRIAQPGGEESLNVAAAAAICLYASTVD
ncbi:MAG: RNA methyltransferase [Burkholderiaceae bacterium]|nr:RNA methyltransferase [Burkholderiaceae bacterium]